MRKNIRKIYECSPIGWNVIAVSAIIIILHFATRSNKTLMVFAAENVIIPVHRFLTQLHSHFNISSAEVTIAAAAAATVIYTVIQIVRLITRKQRLKILCETAVTLCAAVSAVYAGFCILWGVYYFGEDFVARSGLCNEPVSSEQLESATVYFADVLNEYADRVERNDNNVYSASVSSIMEKAPLVFKNAEEQFPCLEGPEVKAKAIHFSRIMSYVDFTGFFFPFTGEANVNVDSPQSMLPSTIAHELAHLRGVAKEQEANFAAVLACMSCGDPDYVYSGSLMAYIHLSNALYDADRDAWKSIYSSLNEAVIADLNENNHYWKQFETPMRKVSNAVYEEFLYSYDQDMGLKSYGACVDMLVNYYG